MLDIEPFLREFANSSVREAMARKGYFRFEQRIDEQTCADLRLRIDRLSNARDTEINYAGSEHRVWHAANKDAAFAPLEALSNALMPHLYKRPSEAFNVLAIRNRPAPPEAERFDVRWHIDSFRKQLKMFAFLTEVGEDNGPLEYVPQTHHKSFKCRNALRLRYYTLHDLNPANRGKRSWRRIHDDTIARVRAMGFPAEPITVPAGSIVLVDTSALHRARPCIAGERYAVTTYHH